MTNLHCTPNQFSNLLMRIAAGLLGFGAFGILLTPHCLFWLFYNLCTYIVSLSDAAYVTGKKSCSACLHTDAS